MPTNSTSAVVVEPGVVETQKFQVPSVSGEEGILSVELAGVCGSDAKAYHGDYQPESLAAILGHEVLGRIESLGDEAREAFGVEEGQRVVLEARRRCGDCEHCLSGRYQFCERGGSYGFTSIDKPPSIWGGHGEYMYLTSGTVVHPVSEDVPSEAAVLGCAVVGNSVRWLQQGTAEPFQQSLLIQGCGPQALSMTIIGSRLGFDPIVVTGLPGDERRLELAAELGANRTVCESPQDIVSASRAAAGGNADVVVNLTGSSHSAQDSIELVSVGGTIVYPNVVGDATSEVRFDELVHKDATIRGMLSRTASDVRRAIDFIERNPDPFTELISHVYSVEEAEQAYQVAGGEAEESPLKVAIDPT